MLDSCVTTTRKKYNFGSRFFSGEYTSEYTYHAVEPRIKRRNKEIVRESRILDNLTLDKVDSLLEAHWTRMFFKEGKWKIFIPSKDGKAMFIISTKKVKHPNGDIVYRAAFLSSYITTSDKKLEANLEIGNTIFLDNEYFESKINSEPASDAEKEVYTIEERKNKSTRVKKKEREKKKETRKAKRKQDSYYPERASNKPKLKKKSRLYIPGAKSVHTKAEQRVRNATKATKERRKKEKYSSI